MELNADEQAWLDEYRLALGNKYPGLVEDMVVFRSDEGRFFLPDYALNTVVILKKGDRQTIKDIDFMGHDLSVLSEAIPFVWVYTRGEWKDLQRDGSLPYKGEGTSVWLSQS